MKQIPISVLMPVYNAEQFLKISIESILNQTFKSFEFIIVDDGSTDNSWKIIQDFSFKDKRIKAFRNKKNLKTTRALNKGLKICKGKYVVRMDADDWSYPKRFEKQFYYMEKNSEVGVSGSAIEVCDNNLKIINKRKYPLTDSHLRKIMFCYSPFAHPATIWRRNLLEKVGGYNENLPLSQDSELYFKIGKIAEFGNLKDILLKLRTHPNSSSFSKDKTQEIYAIYSRIKAILEFKYQARLVDKFYIFGRIVVMFLVPTKFKFWIFNLIRGIK